MSRHTLADGVTPDPEITKIYFDRWWPQFAPPPLLIGAYYKRGLPWESFAKQFNEYLREPDPHRHLCRLVEYARALDLTLLCVEPTPERCHRRLVAEACREIDQSLLITIE